MYNETITDFGFNSLLLRPTCAWRDAEPQLDGALVVGWVCRESAGRLQKKPVIHDAGTELHNLLDIQVHCTNTIIT